ncbi:hypothetical protein ACFLQW_00810 [Candidatus Zixiibacteriota bacterium]
MEYRIKKQASRRRRISACGAALQLVIVAVLLSSVPVQAEPGVAVEIRVKEFVAANPPVSAWVDSNVVLLPVGVEVYALQGNFGINLLASAPDSTGLNLQYRLATLGANVRQRSGIVKVEWGVPVVIDSIPGKGKSFYRALVTPRAAEVSRSCLEDVGDPIDWPNDPSAYFNFYYVPNSLADAHWNMLRDFLEREYKTVHETFAFDYPGPIHFYFCPCAPENIDFEAGLGLAIDPGRLAGFGIYHQEANSVDPQITNLLKFYRWWGFAPRFLVWGVSGYTDFADYYAKEYLRDNRLLPFDSLLISRDFRQADPLVAYFESASFVRFLIDSIGVAAFHDLYERSTDLSLRPAFLAVTGQTIDWWETKWRRYLSSRKLKYQEYIYFAHRAQAINRPTEQLELLEKGTAEMGDSVTVPLIQELAAAYYSQGRYGDAYVWFKKLVEREPDAAQYKQYCGNAAVVLGQLDEAYEYFAEAVALDTTFAASYLSMGEVMSLRNYPDSAVALWRTGLGRGESIPVYIELLIHLAQRERQTYERDSATVKLTMARNSTARLLGQFPDHPRYLLRMAEILTEMNQPDSALAYYAAAQFFENRPYYQARIHLGAGKAADLAGRRKEAVEHYEKVFGVRAGYPTRKEAEKYINQIYR